MATHDFHIQTNWCGNTGSGTADYRSYSRNHELFAEGKNLAIQGSSDAAFRGDGARYNPEELLVGSISTCHMLWMLHLCADQKIVITAYEDSASGTMQLNADGSGQFVQVTLRPRVTIADESRADEMEKLHHRAHGLCFIARSVNFPVTHEPETIVKA
jgi:organic hydroperoxide reductase OsmC/OhrA